MAKSKIKLNSFYVFNSTLCLKEGEEENKILFYHPFSAELDTKIKNIGLVEAVIKFTDTFNPSEPCSSLHTQKTRHIYLQPEPNFWMVMILDVPNISKNKDGADYNEYQGDDIQDNVYTSLLKQIYAHFKLLNGKFDSLLNAEGIEVFKKELNLFFPKCLLSLSIEHCDILNVFRGIQYLPLNNLTFLNVLCFVNDLQQKFNESIKHTAVMYNDYLIWTGLEPDVFQSVYQFMIQTLLPAHVETELQIGNNSSNNIMSRHSTGFFTPHSQQSQHYCRFVTGPANFDDLEMRQKVPKIYLENKNQLDEYYLLVYRGFSTSIVLFLDKSTSLNLDYFKKLDQFLEPQLTKLGSEIAKYCTTQQILFSNFSENGPRYIFFNEMNRAVKTTVHLDNRQAGNVNISEEELKLIADIKAGFSGVKRKAGFYGETVVKTMNDCYWVVGKVSNDREFYVAIQHKNDKNANLIAINEEVKKLCDAELKGIFFQT